MTVKLKTMKTGDMDYTGNESQEFLKTLNSQDQDSGDITENTTKITKQQKLKIFLHWFVLIGSHIFIFWYVPLKGNFDLYKDDIAPMCNVMDTKKYRYGCRNF